MLFNSAAFAIFFLLIFSLYWALRRHFRAQNHLLLAASLLFYGWWDVRFLYLFILTTTVDFYCALMIRHGVVPLRQRLIESAFLLGSAFFCVTVQWPAVHLLRQGLSFSLHIDWPNLFPHDLHGWAILLATAAVVLLVNLAHPLLTRLSPQRRARFFMGASIISNLSVLGFFKYFNFFAESFTDLVQTLFGVTPGNITLHIILPVGISFYTFQSLAYTIDAYRRKIEPIAHYTLLATYLAFFPQLVAGPIERPHHLLPQFFRPRTLDRTMFREGIWLITWGLFKKMVVADNMALIVNDIFRPFDTLAGPLTIPTDGLRLLLGVYAFALQIYGDFSGYTDIARGTARLLGFDIMLNFNLPYFAISPSDFWKRWHISLSSWLRDYLYIPLGGNRGSGLMTYRNLFLTMLLGGLWHGAAWTFVAWGAYHGLLLIGYRLLAPNLDQQPATAPVPLLARLRAIVRPATATVSSVLFLPFGLFAVPPSTPRRAPDDPAPSPGRSYVKLFLLGLLMFHFTCLGWLLFRAQNMTTVGVFLESIALHPHWSPAAASIAKNILFYSWFLILFQILQALMGTLNPMARLPGFLRLNIWLILVMSLLAFSAKSEQAFIYFAF